MLRQPMRAHILAVHDACRARVDVGKAVPFERPKSACRKSRYKWTRRTLVPQQAVHISNVDQILPVLARDADRRLPLLYQLEDLLLRGAWENGRPFGKALDELVEKFFCSDLQMEGVAAILDEVVQQLWLSVL